MAFDAVLWDMDGTLVDTERVVWDVMKDAFREIVGILLDESLFHSLLGQSENDFFDTVQRLFGLNDAEVQEIGARFNHDYVPRLSDIPALPGAVEAVRHTQLAGPIALVTGSTLKQAEAVVKALRVKGLFDEIVACDHYERGKPHPEPYLMAAKKLGVKADKCLAIEDSPSGVKAAKAAGMKVIGVHEGNKGKYDIAHADLEIPSLVDFDLLKVAKSLGVLK
ncbi:MAG: HAD family phosphatase [Planctomycetes bacterium]|nr:HAD family phosphatase [Planctomycetota bacterium]